MSPSGNHGRPPAQRVGGIILAAGAGTRFGSASKLLATLRGRPVLQYAVDAQCATPALAEVVVVLGADADLVLSQLELGRARAVVCEQWSNGQSASLRKAIEALPEHTRLLVTLGDQPLISAAAISRVAAAEPPARASYAGVPGHPVLLGRHELDAARRLSGDQGARSLLGHATLVPCDGLGSPADIDTRADLEAAQASRSEPKEIDG